MVRRRKPGRQALQRCRAGPGSFGVCDRHLPVPWRRKQRSGPDRAASGFTKPARHGLADRQQTGAAPCATIPRLSSAPIPASSEAGAAVGSGHGRGGGGILGAAREPVAHLRRSSCRRRAGAAAPGQIRAGSVCFCIAQDRLCHEQGRRAKVAVIIREGKDRLQAMDSAAWQADGDRPDTGIGPKATGRAPGILPHCDDLKQARMRHQTRPARLHAIALRGQQYGVATQRLLQYIRAARPPTRRGAGAVERGGLENR